ncbi:hypothetical protein [Rhodococcus chondri]|uniref:Uncharacterized protein n=1 Tax=Rhodococcus chondri TaxID=3065941 RepID=A0ABU7JV67_9NOCA|nr:hypothetical protein [Rhodococcus sp. CC-R104]MEE2033916.1 hypothetical protein [Rhodococcus sp. CC-R104]
MMSPSTPQEPKNSKTSSTTHETVLASPRVGPPLSEPDDESELELAADAASEISELGAAIALGITEHKPEADSGPAAAAGRPAGQSGFPGGGLLAPAKQTGTLMIDTYETALGILLAVEQRVGAMSGLGWIDRLTRAHVSLVTSVSSPMFSAVRKVLK